MDGRDPELDDEDTDSQVLRNTELSPLRTVITLVKQVRLTLHFEWFREVHVSLLQVCLCKLDTHSVQLRRVPLNI